MANGQPQEKEFVRFTRLNRTLHAFMIVSFISLALTGLTLKFSYTAWAMTLSHLLGGYETAGYIHRFSAVVMFATFFFHLKDLYRMKKENGSWRALILGPNTMLPTRRDFREFVATMKWFVGLGPRPHYGRWTYWEKFDYFAVFWGIAIIGASGLLLWFPTFFARFLPGRAFNLAIVVHSDEALLAVGFIFMFHFFNANLRPEKFPMDPVIFTGRIDAEEFRRDHPAEYERLEREGRLERLRADAPPRWLRNFAWVVGFCGLGTGLVLIWLIVTTVLR